MDTSDLEENTVPLIKGRTEARPEKLPVENEYDLPRYFVRDCYPEYYCIAGSRTS
ncbi:hypothetical protein JG688_00017943 [Phytophthora aleatoria]|uniref:Uncharacterized protein n=1 Tax=Phytophthora aleatoria TaxID=2496075 RepID=A0A8J5MBU5_9STRA|nr:hypothetical protein JG688_00017943 [Phytophthora aleatoria]